MGEQEYRRKAQSYLAAARAMHDPDAKSAFIDMATRYMELAQQDKRIADLVEKAGVAERVEHKVTQSKFRSHGWRTGQRVSREDSDGLGTIVEADGYVKVRWDDGRTSYFDRDKPSNVRLKEIE